MSSQDFPVPLRPGARLTIANDGCIEYVGVVECHVPETGLLEMDDGKGRAYIYSLIEDADSIQVAYETE